MTEYERQKALHSLKLIEINARKNMTDTLADWQKLVTATDKICQNDPVLIREVNQMLLRMEIYLRGERK